MKNFYLSPLKPPDGDDVSNDDDDTGDEVTEENGKAFLKQQKKNC